MEIVNKDNLFRIVDNDLKESLIIYLIKKNKYNIYLMNK